MRINKKSKIYVAGHEGMVGSALVRSLSASGYTEIITKSRNDLNLLDQNATYNFLSHTKPDYIFLAAAKVGGIFANNNYKADFILENLQIQNNIIMGALQNDIKDLCFLGSSCVYPRSCPQPIKEEYLLTGPLEKTNEPYALAKISGIKSCESSNMQYGTRYVVVMPTNLYGPNDEYDLEKSHVLPALIRKAHEAKIYGLNEITVWGTGNVRREFLYVEDLADACIFLMEKNITSGIYNIGSGVDLTIRELVSVVSEIVGFSGSFVYDATMPDGTPRKLLDISRIAAHGWQAKTPLKNGIEKTYAHFLARYYPKDK
jgi:GDP-L-fucose synthase